MLRRHSLKGRKSDKRKAGIASMPGLEAVSLFFYRALVSGEVASPSFVNSIFNTICGVVSDYLQCVHESVFNNSGGVAAEFCGYNLNTLLVSVGSVPLIQSFATSGGSPGCDVQMTFAPDTGAVSPGHRRAHSSQISRSRTAGCHTQDLDDSLSRSPLKLNRAGIYEKGDSNQ